jgi:hypothetical protein
MTPNKVRYLVDSVLHGGTASQLFGVISRPAKHVGLFLRAAARVSTLHREVTWHLVVSFTLRPGGEAPAIQLGIRDCTIAENNFGWDRCLTDREEFYRTSLLATRATEGAPSR